MVQPALFAAGAKLLGPIRIDRTDLLGPSEPQELLVRMLGLFVLNRASMEPVRCFVVDHETVRFTTNTVASQATAHNVVRGHQVAEFLDDAR